MHSDSISSASPAPAPSEETMQIFVKTIKGETIPLNVPSNATVGELTTLLSTNHSVPTTNMRLIHSGRHLSTPSSPLSAYSVRPESTISLSLPLRGGKPNLPKCEFKKGTDGQCKKAQEKIVGDCGFCGGHFCTKHRLLESHNCEGLEDCKKESHERNAEKLNTERTVAIKGI